jgi:hypothetical protein
MEIREENKIAYIGLAHEINENPDMTVNKAFKKAKNDLNFEGNIGDFLDFLKFNGLIEDVEATKRIEEQKQKEIERKKKMLRNITIGVVVLGAGYIVIKMLDKKQ